MATELKLRRGTTSQHSGFTGAEAEVTVDTDKETVVVHDGSTAGGYPLAREDMSNVPDDTISGDQIEGGTIGSVQIDSADINGGSITGTDIDVSGATFTVANDQISGSAIDGGTSTPTNVHVSNFLGVNTTSPQSQIDSSGVGNFKTEFNDFTGDGLHIQCNGTDGNGNYAGGISFSRISSDNDSRAAGICAVQTKNDFDEVGLAFFIHSTPTTAADISEAARIDSDGRLLINTTVAESAFRSTVLSTGSGGVFALKNSASTGTPIRFYTSTNTKAGEITTDGNSTSYNTSSDYRLKENVTDLSDGITRLKNLPVHRFNFIAEPDKTVDGFLAHEVQPYVPEAISGEKDEVEAIGDITDADGEIIEEGVTEPAELKEGQTWTQTGEQPVYQGIDQSKLVPLLTAALQEAAGKIEQQQTQIDDLLARVTALETE